MTDAFLFVSHETVLVPRSLVESIPIVLNAIPFATFATNWTLRSTLSPLTLAPEESRSRPDMVLDVNAVWLTLERQRFTLSRRSSRSRLPRRSRQGL